MVTDVRMPIMSGPQLAERVEQMRPGLPILFATGFADELLRRDPGAAARMLTKPYDARRLAHMLERALESLPVT